MSVHTAGGLFLQVHHGGGCGKHARVVQWECQPRQCLAHVPRARRRLVSRNWRVQCFQQTLHRKWRQSAQWNWTDRKSVLLGKRLSLGVDIGGSTTLKKKTVKNK